MERDEDALLTTFFFAFRTILNPDSSIEERRKEARHLRFVHALWQGLYPETPALEEINCVLHSGGINTRAWTLAKTLHQTLVTQENALK
jgi:hypothetical protein